jgi:hypothetical protein
VLLGEAMYFQAWAEGRAMSWEQAVAYALAITRPPDAPAADAAPSTPTETGTSGLDRGGDPEAARLTAREREVAALVARGRTNR